MHDCAREQVEELRGKSDIVIALTHLGVDDDIAKGYVKKDEEGNGLYNDLYEKGYRSVDLFKDVEGIDLMLDGHSHTTMTGCAGDDRANFNIQSAGIQLQNIGVVIIGKDENGQPAILDRYLIPEKYYSQIGEDPKISAYIQYVIDCAKNNKEIQDYDPKDYEDIESISADAASIDSSKDVTADAAVVASTEEDIIDAASTASSLEDSEEATTESSEDIEDSASTEKSEDTSNKKHGKNNHHSHNRKNNHKTGFGGR